MAINEQAIALVEEILEIAEKLGPEIGQAITAAASSAKAVLVAADLPASDADVIAKEADAEIATKFTHAVAK